LKLHLLLDPRLVTLSCGKSVEVLKLLYYCSRLQHTLRCLTNSAGQPCAGEVPLVVPLPSPRPRGTAGCAHQGQETFPFHELLHINSYEGHLRAVWEWKICFIKGSDQDLRGWRRISHSDIPQLIPGALCDFGGLPAPGHTAMSSKLYGCSHAGEAGSLKPVAAGERVPTQTLRWGLFSVVGCTEGAQFPRREESVMMFIQLEHGIPLLSHARWDLSRCSLPRMPQKSHLFSHSTAIKAAMSFAM